MAQEQRSTLAWMDLLWVAFLAGLAVLQPIFEIHKQMTLVGIGIFQISERWFVGWAGPRGRAYSVLIKILLASLLVAHTGAVPINSSYYLIYYLPVISAAILFGPVGTLAWTAAASAAYCSFLLVAIQEYELTAESISELALRNVFFFLAAIVVNRFVTENRRQAQRYRQLAETLSETNRRLEQAQAEARRSERLAALGQLSAGLAHELRNPLGVIKGSAETLSRKLESADALARELAGYISSEVNRLNVIISRFLDFARPSQLEMRPEEITPLVERALKAVHDRWPEARIEIEREYSPDLPPVPVDAELCEQVFINLVVNAYEAMPSGGTLRVAVGPASVDGRRGIEVEIADSGSGIPPELRDQIFNPFFTTKKEGVGLGLSIVSKIVDDHAGSIRVSSGSGQGACFKVFFSEESKS